MSLDSSKYKEFRFFRLPISKSLGVRASIVIGENEHEEKYKYYEVELTNVSLTGLAFLSPIEITLKTIVKIHIVYKKVHYLFQSSVRRSTKEHQRWFIGVVFDEKDHFLSAKFLEKLVLNMNPKELKKDVVTLITNDALASNLEYIPSLKLLNFSLKEMIEKRHSSFFLESTFYDFCHTYNISYFELKTRDKSFSFGEYQSDIPKFSHEGGEKYSSFYYQRNHKLSSDELLELNIFIDIFICNNQKNIELKTNTFLIPTKPRELVFVGVGQAVKKIREFIKKTKYNNLPVVIQGMPNDGKELLAKIIHTESKRKNESFEIIEGQYFISYNLEQETVIKNIFNTHIKGSVIILNFERMDLHYQKIIKNHICHKILEREHNARIILTFSVWDKSLFDNDNTEFLLVQIPPLKERYEDIYELIHFFVKKECEKYDLPQKLPTHDFMEEIKKRIKYGIIKNVGELKKIISKVVMISKGDFFIDMTSDIREYMSSKEIEIINQETYNELIKLTHNDENLIEFIVKERFHYFKQNLKHTSQSLGINDDDILKILDREKFRDVA